MTEDYSKARKLGERAYRKAVASGQFPYLISLDSFLPEYETLPKISVGVKEIPLSMVVGTVTAGRQNSFACNFMPLLEPKTEFAQKWSRLVDIQAAEGIRDAVLVYEYMHRFYVQEGNKRVSVLRYIGALGITADVRRILPKKTEDREIQAYYEFLDFFRVTGLYGIECSSKGSYAKLASVYGENLEQPWPETKIEDLRSDFRTFEKCFLEKGGERLSLTTGDAFLLYLSIYKGVLPDSETPAEIGKNLGRMWDELQSITYDRDIALIEDSSSIGKGAGVLDTLTRPVYTREKPLRVAFLHAKTAEESRWVYSHELGRNEVNTVFDGIVDAISFENCRTDDKIDKAFEAAAADRDAVVFTTSADMMDAAMRAAVKYPEMKILNCSISLMSSAVRTYYPKTYEAKFLMGALAASFAEDHRIGYVADYPIYGSLANINAFAIGAAMIDPGARIILKWSGKKNSCWEKELEEEGLRIISGPDSIRPQDPGRKYGVYRIEGDGSIKNLAAPILHWGKYYRMILNIILNGGWNAREQAGKNQPVNYWFGLEAGVIDVIHSDELPYYSRKMLKLFRSGIISHRIDPFRGELHSQTGMISGEGAPSLESGQIIKMNWLNDNVEGSIPSEEEMVDSVRSTMEKIGIEAAK